MHNLQLIDEPQSSGLRDFFTIFFKHKTRILTVFFAIVAIVTVATFLIAPVYEARSSLLVKIGREYMSRPEVGRSDSAPPILSLSPEEIANSEIQILTSRDSIEKVLSTIKLENIYPDLLKDPAPKVPPMDAAVTRFSKNLGAYAIKKSSVIEVSFRHTDPRIAATAVNMLVEQFKEKHLQVFSDPRSSFLDMQRSSYEQKLQESAKNLQTFKQKAGVFALPEQRTLLLNQRMELDTAWKGSQNTIQELNKRISTLKYQIKNITDNKAYYTHSERDGILVGAKAKILELQLAEQDLLRKYTESNRLVVKIRKEIELASQFVKEQEADISSKVKTGNPVYQDAEMQLIKAETELNAQKAKAAALQQQVAQVDGQIRTLESSEGLNQQLIRDHTTNEKNYQTYVEKSEEARISDEMNRLKMANISIIQKATVPSYPVKPKRSLNILLGIMLGLIAGLGLAFLSESTSQGFTTPEKIEKSLGLPVLTTIALKEG